MGRVTGIGETGWMRKAFPPVECPLVVLFVPFSQTAARAATACTNLMCLSPKIQLFGDVIKCGVTLNKKDQDVNTEFV